MLRYFLFSETTISQQSGSRGTECEDHGTASHRPGKTSQTTPDRGRKHLTALIRAIAPIKQRVIICLFYRYKMYRPRSS